MQLYKLLGQLYQEFERDQQILSLYNSPNTMKTLKYQYEKKLLRIHDHLPQTLIFFLLL